MKTYKTFLLAGLILLGFAACEKDSDPSVSLPDAISLTAVADTITFTVVSNVGWQMKVSEPWFKITPKHGNGTTTVKLAVEMNTTGAQRNSALEFAYANGYVERIPVTQTAYEVEMSAEAPA